MRCGYRAVDSELRAGIWKQPRPPSFFVRKLVHELAYLPLQTSPVQLTLSLGITSFSVRSMIGLLQAVILLVVRRFNQELPLVAPSSPW